MYSANQLLEHLDNYRTLDNYDPAKLFDDINDLQRRLEKIKEDAKNDLKAQKKKRQIKTHYTNKLITERM